MPRKFAAIEQIIESTTGAGTSDGKEAREKSSFKSKAWTSQSEAWQITSDLWESALHIRNLEGEYLQRYKDEPGGKYNSRLNNSVFLNEFRSTIEGMAGTVFRTNPTPTEAPPEITEMFTDIDLCGNSLHAFLLDAFAMYLRDGNGFIYVDTAPFTPDEDGKKPTLKDRLNDRPWWIFYSAAQAINHQYDTVNGQIRLKQITFEEKTTESAGTYGEVDVIRHRVLSIGSWKVLKQVKKDNGDVVYENEDEGTTGLDFIPVVPIAKLGSVPSLLVLAMLNILHYNKTSDFDELCKMVSVPERIYRYDTEEDAKKAPKNNTISPGIARNMWGEHASASFNEVTGDAADVARTRYQDIEQQMAKIGLGMMTPSLVARTALEVADVAGQRESKLSKLARDFENAVEKALYITAQIINAIRGRKTIDLDKAEDLDLQLKIDYNRLTFSMEQLQFFSDLVDGGKLSLETFLEWLPQVADMPASFSPDDEMRKLKSVYSIETDDPDEKDPDDVDPNKDKNPSGKKPVKKKIGEK